jgi:L-ornithine Nalpha-acyltransferase
MTAEPRIRESFLTSPAAHLARRFGAMPLLGRIANLQVRLACGDSEIEAAQELRQSVFRADCKLHSSGRDIDHFDAFCDHLIVLDTENSNQIVGTYRLLREEKAVKAGGFYSQSEFDMEALRARMPQRRILELGRSCVLPQYRTKRTVELLWQGIWAYCRAWNIDMMCGCASFPGAIAAAHALPLSYLHHHASAAGAWSVRAHADMRIDMDMMPVEAVDTRTALAAMPPLIKGYLRVGASFGDGAVADYEFGTTDVFVVLPVERISSRYVAHFGVDADRFI